MYSLILRLNDESKRLEIDFVEMKCFFASGGCLHRWSGDKSSANEYSSSDTNPASSVIADPAKDLVRRYEEAQASDPGDQLDGSGDNDSKN